MSSARFQSEHQSQFLVSPVLRIALFVGVSIHLIGFLVFRVQTGDLPGREPEPALVRYVSPVTLASDLALQEQAELMDSAPLFVPTRWNASQEIVALTSDRLSQRFALFEPKIDLLTTLQPQEKIIVSNREVETPLDLLGLRYWSVFKDFGTSDQTVEPFVDAVLTAEVLQLDRGAAARPSIISVDSPELSALRADAPAVLQLRVSGEGRSLGASLLVESSGSEEFDTAARNWLQQQAGLGQLPAGYLWVRVYGAN